MLAVEPNVSETAAHGLTFVAAGAGSGKTYYLTELVTRAVDPALATAVPVQALLAVTYTRRAASELEARIRRVLAQTNAHAVCQSLPLAHIGTVHAVCLRLLADFAVEAGLSPSLQVMTGDDTHALAQALERALPDALQRQLDSGARALEVRWDARIQRYDWVTPVRDIMTLARGNRVSASALPAMAHRSVERLCSLMGPAHASADELDADLLRELDRAAQALRTFDDGQKNTSKARETVLAAREAARAGRLPWSGWVQLHKLAPGKRARPLVESLLEVAGRVDQHPRLREQLRAYTSNIYEAASIGLTAYDDWKRERCLVDFVDMVGHALTLLDVPAVRQELGLRLALCAVDELQDTSPVQLALFVRLHQLTKRSAWVGDRKQCIFEYAGADPALMDAVGAWVVTAGGTRDILRDNRRSRPELVELCSALFGAAFASHGHAPEEVVMRAHRPLDPRLEELPPLGVFWLVPSPEVTLTDALAQGIERLLARAPETSVIDRGTSRARPITAEDVAVLVATNVEALALTASLARLGIRSAVARSGLLQTPEGTLLDAALRLLVDHHDARARGIVEALSGFAGSDPDAWLENQIRRNDAWEAGSASGGQVDRHVPADDAVDDATATLHAVLRLRADLDVLSPAEAVDRILIALDAAALCVRWPDPAQRLANLDALRALARRYEITCQHQREAASVGGLLRFFDSLRRETQASSDGLAADEQHITRGAGTVTITTYHRSKGLEWPVVILGSLHRAPRRSAFEVLPQTDRHAFDPVDPLGGRWIRYWPWPYGAHDRAPLDTAVSQSREGQAVQEQEARERVRLLYVGFTRARDHLILAVELGRGGPKTAWLDELSNAEGPVLSLPAPTSLDRLDKTLVKNLIGHELGIPTRAWAFPAAPAAANDAPKRESRRWFVSSPKPRDGGACYRIAPSRADVEWFDVPAGVVDSIHVFGTRLPLASERPEDWNIVGDALHAFLAADVHDSSRKHRLDTATRLLAASDLLTLLQPHALLHTADQLRAWMNARWPNARWHRELPVAGLIASPFGARLVEGTVDLLLETENGFVLVDYKSYPGRRETWRAKATEYVRQIAAYAAVLRLTGRNIESQWIALPVAGGMVEINDRPTVSSIAPAATEGV